MKRIIKTLSQKWPEYLLEILVITIGIFGAFSLNNWKEHKQETNVEKSALIDLRNEFLVNRAKLQRSIIAKQEGLDNSLLLIKISQTKNIDLETFRLRWGLRTINPSFGVIDKLTATGKIDYLQNDSLRYLLSRWKESVLDLKENEDNHLEFIMKRVRPHINELIPFPALARNPLIRNLRLYKEEQSQHFVEILMEDLLFQNHLARNIGRCDNILAKAYEVKEMLDEILVHLDAEIASKS